METNFIVTELSAQQIIEQVELNCDMHAINSPKNWEQKLSAFINPPLRLSQIETQAPDEDYQSQDSYQLGMLEYISYLIGQMLNETPIPDHTTLMSIQTYSNYWFGIHTWTFALNNIEELDKDETLLTTLIECFHDIFPYDSEACFGSAPQVYYCNGAFTIIVPFTC